VLCIADAISWVGIFLVCGYFVSTVGRDEEEIRGYFRNQEVEDARLERFNLWRRPVSVFQRRFPARTRAVSASCRGLALHALFLTMNALMRRLKYLLRRSKSVSARLTKTARCCEPAACSEPVKNVAA